MISKVKDLHSANDSELVGAIPSNVRWNWVGWHHLSNTHRVIKNDLVEEHFIITTDDSKIAYFKVIYSTEDRNFPIVSKAIRVGIAGGAIAIYNYIPTSIANMNIYKTELNAILDSVNITSTQVYNFINKYMNQISVIS